MINLRQTYDDVKSLHHRAVILFRVGDFYELFWDDARTAARLLGLTLTTRDRGENAIPMAGFPYHQVEPYIGKLVANGFTVVVCEMAKNGSFAPSRTDTRPIPVLRVADLTRVPDCVAIEPGEIIAARLTEPGRLPQ